MAHEKVYGICEDKCRVEVMIPGDFVKVTFSEVIPVGVSTIGRVIDADWIDIDNWICIGCGQYVNSCPSGEIPTTTDTSHETLTRIKILQTYVEYDYEKKAFYLGIVVNNTYSEPLAVNDGWVMLMRIK